MQLMNQSPSGHAGNVKQCSKPNDARKPLVNGLIKL